MEFQNCKYDGHQSFWDNKICGGKPPLFKVTDICPLMTALLAKP